MELIPQENANGKYGFVDENGNWVIEPQFNRAYDFSNGLATVKVDRKWGFIRPDGSWAIEPQFDYAENFSEGLAEVKVDGKYGYIRPDGTWAVEPQFDYAENFSEGLATVEVDGKWGFIRPDGSWAIEPQFDRAYKFSEGLAQIKVDYKYGCIRPDGSWVLEPSYDIIYDKYYPIGRNGQRLAAAHKDGKLTWLDEDRKECPDAVVDYEKASREGRKSVSAEAYGEEWFVDALDEESNPIEGMSAFVKSSLYIEIDGNSIDVDELKSVEGKSDFASYSFCESVGATEGFLYYNKSGADPESFGEILIPEGEEFDPEKACLVTQFWYTNENDTNMVLSLVYDGVLYHLIPIDSITKGSEKIYGIDDDDDDDDDDHDFSWDD